MGRGGIAWPYLSAEAAQPFSLDRLGEGGGTGGALRINRRAPVAGLAEHINRARESCGEAHHQACAITSTASQGLQTEN